MKTPEEMAEEFAAINGRYDPLNANCRWGKNAFIGGYKAAQEHTHAALEEAEARIQKLRDQLMEESGGRLKLFKDDADAKAAYQEALEEVDLDKAWQQGYKTAKAEYQEKLNQMRLERPAFKKHEIENLLSQSNADGYKRGFEQGLIAQNCWISLKDKSPEINQRVLLATNEKRSIVTGCRLAPAGKNEPWFHTDLGLWCGTETVTHWQELPEPPKEEE